MVAILIYICIFPPPLPHSITYAPVSQTCVRTSVSIRQTIVVETAIAVVVVLMVVIGGACGGSHAHGGSRVGGEGRTSGGKDVGEHSGGDTPPRIPIVNQSYISERVCRCWKINIVL